MKVSFVVLTWNRYKFLDKCLNALIPSIDDIGSSEIIVMDNGSTDDTNLILDKYKNHPNVTIIQRKHNHGLNSYKKLFRNAHGDYIVIVDDDVLEFPQGIDAIFVDYMITFPEYGFLALDVLQNQYTNGAKPEKKYYTEYMRNGKVIETGPTGGWCSCFRAKEYRKIRFRYELRYINMKYPEDALLVKLFDKVLGLKSGIIKDTYCFHACGPYYAKEYGHLHREIQKYRKSGLKEFVKAYKKYID
jgi:glycosyltransferase involved in cell wall biosynthesis